MLKSIQLSNESLAQYGLITKKGVEELINIDQERVLVMDEVEESTAGEILFEATNYEEDLRIPLKDFVKMLDKAGVKEIEAKWIQSVSNSSLSTIICYKPTKRKETNDEVVERVVEELRGRQERYKQFLELEKEFG